MVLAVRSPDPVLSVVAPIGLAANVPACLVVDLADELSLKSSRSLADILAEGPRLEELSPGRRGVAIISGGSIRAEQAESVVGELATRWPGIVVRPKTQDWPGPTVPVIPIYPGLLSPGHVGAAVWQPAGATGSAPGPGPVLPRLRPGLVRGLLSGRLPTRSHWVAAWRQVWDLPWA
jgi:hypothetical protein